MTEKSSFNIKNGFLFPLQFQILGYSFLIFGLISMIINVWVSITFILIGFFLVTAYGGVEFKNSRYREYNAFYFLRSGKWQAYSNIEKIFINKLKTSQQFYGRANQSSVIKGTIYKAFLKFENGEKVLLYESKSKDKLAAKVQKANEYLQTEIVDYSDQ